MLIIFKSVVILFKIFCTSNFISKIRPIFFFFWTVFLWLNYIHTGHYWPKKLMWSNNIDQFIMLLVQYIISSKTTWYSNVVNTLNWLNYVSWNKSNWLHPIVIDVKMSNLDMVQKNDSLDQTLNQHGTKMKHGELFWVRWNSDS